MGARPPAVVGSKIRFQAQFLGRTLDYTYEVREIELGRRFVMATAPGTLSDGDCSRLGGHRRGDEDVASESWRANGVCVRHRTSHGGSHEACQPLGSPSLKGVARRAKRRDRLTATPA